MPSSWLLQHGGGTLRASQCGSAGGVHCPGTPCHGPTRRCAWCTTTTLPKAGSAGSLGAPAEPPSRMPATSSHIHSRSHPRPTLTPTYPPPPPTHAHTDTCTHVHPQTHPHTHTRAPKSTPVRVSGCTKAPCTPRCILYQAMPNRRTASKFRARPPPVYVTQALLRQALRGLGCLLSDEEMYVWGIRVGNERSCARTNGPWGGVGGD